MTPEVAQAWADLTKHRGWVLALDDMQQIINAMPQEFQAGGWRLYGAIQLRASGLRRAHQREAPKPATLSKPR